MIRSSLIRTTLALSCVAALAGCASMAPRYARPDAPVSAQFRDAATAGVDAQAGTPVAQLDWQQVFLDPRLRQVIALALDQNRDLRIALLNIESQRAQYRIQRADLLPSINASASQSRARGSASSAAGAGVSQSASAEVGFSSWELDLFGRIRSLKNEALETWLATSETQRSTRMTLLAEVAADWLTVAADQQRMELARQTLDSQRETLRLTQAQHDEGTVSGLDLAQVQTSVESARADVARYTTQLAQDRNALELLVGAPVGEALLPQADALDAAVALAPIPGNLESRVLLQRPDVLSAEHALKAADADIGAARAAFFPAISLTASTGRGSDALDSLFDSGNRTWSFTPTVTLPIFHAGALKAELEVSKLSRDIQVATYEKTIQTAFSEVADALAARANLAEQLDAQGALVEATRRSYSLADARYRNGVDSYLDALDSQRALYSAQQDQITLRLTEADNRVTLFKVLGGGADAQAGDLAIAASGDRATQ